MLKRVISIVLLVVLCSITVCAFAVTVGEKNALESALVYLRIMPFSYKGLIDQLSYDGYTASECEYAASNCGADWYEEAAESAKQYLTIMSFSRQGLKEQLEYDGFSELEAEYGVSVAYGEKPQKPAIVDENHDAEQEFEVIIDMTGHFNENALYLEISTNLPDKTKLMLTLSQGPYGSEDGYIGQKKISVENGKAYANGFTNAGAKLTGGYDAKITLIHPSLQDESVRRRLGSNGENMKGPYIITKEDLNINSVECFFGINASDSVLIEHEDDYQYTVFDREAKTEQDETDEMETEVISVDKGFDVSSLSFSDLIKLQEEINLALWNSDEWQEVTVPAGLYQVGRDIPAGTWVVSKNRNWARIRIGSKVNLSGN